MTNYRHGQMINLIDEMNSPLLAVEPQRCVLVRHRNGDCLRCAAVCTTGAISLGEEGIVVSPEKCIGCGTCASACPTGCLTAADPTDEELFGAVEAALAENEGRVAIACERAFAMASGNRMKRDSCDATAPSFVPGKIAGATSDGRPLVGVVCLGRVDESLLVEATARGARSIQLISGPCESCPHRCGGALSDEIIVSAETLLAALGTPSPIDRIRLQHASDTQEILRLRPTASAQDDTNAVNAATVADASGGTGRSDRASSAAAAMANASGISGGAHQASSAANAISPVGCRAERGLSERLSTTRKAAPGGLASSSTMVEFGGDAGCPDRASSAAPQIVFLAPPGRPFDDAYADKLAAADHLLFICGHYEGIDERVYALADHVISLGDYVLTSGELASMVVIDAAVRKLPGVLGAADGPVDESFTSGLLEYPQYTRPADFRGMRVPEVLTSGNHAAIARWRREQSLARTAAARPDLIAAAEAADRLTPADQKFLKLLEPAPTGAAEGVS